RIRPAALSRGEGRHGRDQAGTAGGGLAAALRRLRQEPGRAPVVVAPQARRVGDRAQVPADRAPGRRPPSRPRSPGARARTGARTAAGAGARLMRRRLSLLVSATMALTLLAFAIPLAILIRVLAEDRALASANDDVRALSAQVAAAPDPASVRQDLEFANRPMTVFLPGHHPLGARAPRTADVQLAERGTSFTVSDADGRQILIAVQGLPQGTAVVRAFVSNAELTNGVTSSWLILAGLGVLLLAVGIVVANLLVGTVTRPISDLAGVSHELAAGGLDARADPAGPPEVRELAHGLNHLAGRIRELIWQERESIADLSHR